MKNKRLLYILIPLVLLIWGIIFYKIFTQINHGNDKPFFNQGLKNSSVTNNVKDTFTIKANYRDPFLTGHQKSTFGSEDDGQMMFSTAGFSKKKEPKTDIVIPDLHYFGLIANTSKKQRIGLFRLNNKDALLKEGEVIEEFKIVRLFNDSVKITFKKIKKTIQKNPNKTGI